ncbi:hypothetical protein B0H11DRAFT_2237258 [Mycena galericulata]|nr:hypothetical protein B0H11DRAFT_2237258 [Mycena galericulata]
MSLSLLTLKKSDTQRSEFCDLPFLSADIRPLVVTYDIGCQLRSCRGHMTFPDNKVASTFNAETRQMGPGERRDRLDDELSWKTTGASCWVTLAHGKYINLFLSAMLKGMSRRHESECFWHELVCDLCKAHGRNKPEDLIEMS